MSNCPACERAAVHPRTGIYQANCKGCEIRSIAQSPAHVRAQAYAQQPHDELAAYKAAVMAEYRRITGKEPGDKA